MTRALMSPRSPASLSILATAANAQEIDWPKVDAAFGRKPAVTGDVHRYGFPRTDLKVTLDGVTIKPALALGGWIAFMPDARRRHGHGRPCAAGDRDQPGHEQDDRERPGDHRDPQSSAAQLPATFYMHVGGHGDPAKWPRYPRGAGARARRRCRPAGCRLAASRHRPRHGSARPDHRRQGTGQRRHLSVWPCHGAIPLPKTECKSRLPGRWACTPRSISSRPAAARQPLPAISC